MTPIRTWIDGAPPKYDGGAGYAIQIGNVGFLTCGHVCTCKWLCCLCVETRRIRINLVCRFCVERRQASLPTSVI